MGIAVRARPASTDDIPVLTGLYRALESEMVSLHGMWPRADGLDEPVEQSLEALLEDPEAKAYIGEIDDYPLGFIIGRSEPLNTHEAARVAAIRFVFVDEDARAVGLGEAMRDLLMEDFRAEGHTLFDAHVLPGHRLAKNFFEAGGFSARTIVMHHDDDR